MEPGTGKTRTLISILSDRYKEHGRVLRTIILTPLVVVEQFKREFEHFPEIPIGYVRTLTGPNARRIKEFDSFLKYNAIFITNYEALYNPGLRSRFTDYAEVLVCDESSKIKNIQAARTKACIKIADNCLHRYLLSGTPILSSQMDIFAQFRVLDSGKTFGENFYIFRAQYFEDQNAAWKSSHSYFPKWVPRYGANERISRAIAPISMHVRKEEAIDLPAYVRTERFVEMGKDQAKAYKEMRDNFLTMLSEKFCVADMALTKLLRLQQIVSGFIKFDDDTEKEFEENPRLDALAELLEELAPYHKVIVWAVFKKNYSQIKKLCDAMGFPTAELTGETTDKDAEVKRFMADPLCRVMIANQQAGGIGVNLTAATYSIFYSRNFSLEADVQAEARNFRGGSLEAVQQLDETLWSDGKRKITRIDLIGNESVDAIILEAIRNKLQTANEVLSLVRKRI